VSQPTRVLNLRHERYDPRSPDFTYIGRANGWYCLKGSKWRNPFKIGEHGDRQQVIARYRRYLLEERPDLLEDLAALRGRALYCFCAPPGGLTAADRPYVCHGQVLCELADALPEEG
jgi:hypothetical protein